MRSSQLPGASKRLMTEGGAQAVMRAMGVAAPSRPQTGPSICSLGSSTSFYSVWFAKKQNLVPVNDS